MQPLEIEIFRSSNPEKLIVYRAGSLKNEVRFYFNKRQYFAATDENDEFGISFGEVEEEEPKNNKKISEIIKENWRGFCKLLLVSAMISAIFTSVIFLVFALTDNTFISLFAISIMSLLIKLGMAVVTEWKSGSPSKRSKHSAEHKMVNFLEQNGRLPRNLKELKASSRFAEDCGSTKQIKEIPEEFIAKIIAILFAVTSQSVYIKIFEDIMIALIIFLVVYLLITALIMWLFKKYHKLKIVTKPLKTLFSNIVQCANTARKINEQDIVLAYWAGAEWMKIVYPQFYKWEDDESFRNDINAMLEIDPELKRVFSERWSY